MRHLSTRTTLCAAGLVIGLFVPTLARAQAPAQDLDASTAPRPPRVKPNGPVFIRAFGGFIAGQSSVSITGFFVGGGVALPLAGRETMELQIDFSYSKYSGGPESDGPNATTELSGRAIAPTVLFIYNLIRDGQKVVPFVGGGLIFANTSETTTDIVDFPGFHSRSVFTSKSFLTGPQGVVGVQFVGSAKAAFRLEGRLGLTSTPGVLVAVLGGVSF